MSRRSFPSRHTTAVAALLGGALLLTSCSSEGDNRSAEPLTFAIANDPLVFNPTATGNGNDTWYVNRQIFESLLYANPDNDEIEPWLADSYEVNDDSTEFTFVIRDGVTFSNGTPLTAKTVAANFDDIKEAGAAAAGSADFTGYASSEVTGDNTVVVTFDEPNASFLSAVAGVPFAIVAPETLEIPYAERASGEEVFGTGPYTLEDYAKDESVTLSSREDYAWAPERFENRGEAHVEQVTFTIVPESGVRTGGLSSGQLDVAGGIAPNDIETIESTQTVVSRANPGTVFGLYLNYDQPIFQDEKVREAISRTVNATEVRDGSLNDAFRVADSPLSGTTKDHRDVSEFIASSDADEARRLLDEAGWIEGPDGVREKDGTPLNLRFTYINNFGPNADSISIIQDQLKAVGISSSQVSGTVPEYQATLVAGDFDISWANLSRVDGDVLRTVFGDIGSDTNYPISDEQIQQLLIEQYTTSDPDSRTELLGKLQQEIVEGYFFIPVHELTTVIGVSSDVTNVYLGADSRLDLLVDTQTGA